MILAVANGAGGQPAPVRQKRRSSVNDAKMTRGDVAASSVFQKQLDARLLRAPYVLADGFRGG